MDTVQQGARVDGNSYDDRAALREQLKNWREELLDLSKRNRLLRFRHTKATTLEISEPGYVDLLNRLPRGLEFASLPSQKAAEEQEEENPADPEESLPSAPSAPPALPVSTITRPGGSRRGGIITQRRYQEPLDQSLRRLDKQSRTAALETGIWVLYLGVGFLEWKDPADRDHSRAPLLLVPVELQITERGNFRLRASEASEAVINPSLGIKLAEYGIDWSEVEEAAFDEPAEILAAARRCASGQRDWTVDDSVVLALFTFHKEAMYRDLLANESAILNHPLVRAVASDPRITVDAPTVHYDLPSLEQLDAVQEPETAPLVLDADAYQRRAVAAAGEGKSFVLNGPPGTGKSQTIANIIAGLIHAGRTVLFVSEKAAALDVVQNRLASRGLDIATLPMHDGKTRGGTVAKTLYDALYAEVKPFPVRVIDGRTEARRLRERLSRHALAMNEVDPALGLSLHEAMGRLARRPEGIPGDAELGMVTPDAALFTVEGQARSERIAKDMIYAWNLLVAPEESPWYGIERVDGAQEALQHALTTLNELNEHYGRHARIVGDGRRPDTDTARKWAVLLESLDERDDVPHYWLVCDDFDTAVATPLAHAADRLTELAALRAQADFDWRTISRLPSLNDIEARTPAPAEMPAPIPLASLTEQDARGLAELCATWNRPMGESAETIAEVVRRTGLSVPDDHYAAQRLLTVATDLSAFPLPESEWLADDRLEEVCSALESFVKQRARLRASRAAAVDMFHPGVLERDDLAELRIRLRLWEKAVHIVTRWKDVPAHWLTADDFAAQVRAPAVAAWERWRNYVHADAELRAAVDIDWKDLPDLDGHTDPGCEGADFDTTGLSADRARSDAEFFSRWAATLEHLLAVSRDTAQNLSLPVPSDHDGVHAVLEAAVRLGTAALPMPTWLDEDTLRVARATARRAETGVAELRQAREAASNLFTDQVLAQDGLVELRDRLTRYGTLDRIVSASYRADRKLAASLTVSETWDRRIPERMDDAVRWQRAHRALEEGTAEYQTVLGGHWSGEHTDFAAVRAAMDTAELLTTLVPATDRNGVRRFLAHGQPPDRSIVEQAETALGELKPWQETASQYLPGGAGLAERPLGQAAAWLSGAATRLRSDADLIDLLTPVVGEAAATANEARNVRDSALRVRAAQEAVDADEAADRSVLGPFWRASVSWEQELRQTLDWAEQAAQEGRAVLGGIVEGTEAAPHDITSLRDQATAPDLSEAASRVQGALGQAYHRDRSLAASLTVDGRWRTEIADRLEDAQRWNQDQRLLSEAEPRFAECFGSFWDGERTDDTAVQEAVAKAERWLRELDSQETATLARFIAEGDLRDLAGRLDEAHGCLVGWPNAARSQLRGATALARLAPADSVQWLRVNAERTSQTAELIRCACDTTTPFNTAAEADWHVKLARRIEAAENASAAAERTDRELLGRLYSVSDDLEETLGGAVDWARRVRGHIEDLTGSPAPGWSAEAIPALRARGSAADLRGAVDMWEESRHAFAALFDRVVQQRLTDELGGDLAAAENRLFGLRDSISSLSQWRVALSASESMRQYGFGPLLHRYIQAGGAAELWPQAVEHAVLRAWVDKRLADDDRLRLEPGQARDAEVAEFRDYDLRLQEWALHETLGKWAGRRPPVLSQSVGITTIKREAMKKSRHMPVRRLMEEAGSDIQVITPCLMMSPLTVSMFLPESLTFDVVIFDEASQVKPADAINCVYRGRSLIVAGDQKQLPPTSFFDRMTDEEEWDEEQPDVYESLLDMCKAGGRMRDLPLRWHYRSRHEDLITFSNRKFYDSELITFPGARVEDDDTGVAFIKADGVYDRGGRRNNRIEAQQVAERVVHHFRTRPEMTLGVVALSKEQANAIEDALDKTLEKHPEFRIRVGGDRLDGFFVKNLEMVQGDERDVIILSVGYGPAADGKISKNFGPINRADGYRRLNVAITRAKHRVEVVSSFSADEFPLKPDDKEGLRRLCEYLRYAEHGPAALDAQPVGDHGLPAETESPFEDSVLSVLRDWGYDVQPQVGVAGYRIDLGIRHPDLPGRYVLGVECDGVMYHSSRVARDRDRLRDSVLESMGWRMHRIWGTEWYRHRAEAEQRLREAVETAVAAPVTTPVTERTEADTAEEQAEPIVEIPAEDERNDDTPGAITRGRPWLKDYVEAEPTMQSGEWWPDPRSPEARSYLQRLFLSIVEVETPIENDLLFRRAFDSWPGGGRLTGPVRTNFEQALRGLIRKGELRREGSTVSEPGRRTRVRRPAGLEPRKVAEVPAVERREAVRLLAVEAGRIARDALLRSVRELFGWKRSGKDIAKALNADVDSLIAKGAIREEDGLVSPAET